ncbi:hypothetical protein HPB49_022512 [Dermacentor silvarum]|uniref:Uncharacterized protein n=1 Tax=Dermacentor silvarum TaxID=543639 RepID=A0ACB8C5N6_DERSI|nr:hypothetical protein HPB49_022512 [Dermacentor silvarum]
MWKSCSIALPRKEKKCSTAEENSVINLTKQDLPQQVLQVLRKGPKYAVQPKVTHTEYLGIVRSVADRAPEQENGTCTQEAAKAGEKKDFRDQRMIGTRKVVTFFKNENLKLLLSNKTSAFRVLNAKDYKTLGMQAILKNSKKSNVESKKIGQLKKRTEKECYDMGLAKLAKNLKECNTLTLRPFFSVKTHKEGHPFRTIVEDKGSWQRALAI